MLPGRQNSITERDTMSKQRVESLQDMFKYTTDHSWKAAEKFPADKRFVQLKPGKGHALWQLGHMALSLDTITNVWVMNGKGILPADWMPKFAPDVMGGAAPHGDAKGYPSWDEIMANYKKVAAQTIELVGSLNDEDLGGELRGPVPPQARSFFGKIGGSLMAMAMHDSHHEGQLALIKGAIS
jgi:hypothetical protein